LPKRFHFVLLQLFTHVINLIENLIERTNGKVSKLLFKKNATRNVVIN